MNAALQATSRRVVHSLNKNSPSILTGMAVAGVLASLYFAIKATPKALHLIDREWQFREEEYGEMDELSFWDKAKVTWKCYIPTAVMGTTTILCIVGANSIHLRRNAALASLLSLTNVAFEEYKDKVIETIGEKKEEKLKDEIVKDHVKANPPTQETIIITGKGDVLCYDDLTKRPFKSTRDRIEKAVNEFNRRLNIDGWLNLNYFYEELGLPATELCEELGYQAHLGLLGIRYTSMLVEGDEPCLVIQFSPRPDHI